MGIAVVTGANKGLGYETVKTLAKSGFKVYMGMRDVEGNAGKVKEYLSTGLDVEAVQIDITSTDSMRKFASLVRDRNERIDVLVNNAGVFLESDGPTDAAPASALKVDPVIILKTIEVNTVGALRIVQSLETLLADGGRIINISSGMGALNGMTGSWPGYRISKTGLNALTCILSAELSSRKISVNSVCPGWIKTDMGGEEASLTVEQGVITTHWLATMKSPPTGGFYKECKEIPW